MKLLPVFTALCISITAFSSPFPNILKTPSFITNELLDEKKLTAIYDGFDDETYNFIGIDAYGEEFFFLVDSIEASVLEKFDLKSEVLKGTKFEVYYIEKSSDDSGNTKITVTKLIKI